MSKTILAMLAAATFGLGVIGCASAEEPQTAKPDATKSHAKTKVAETPSETTAQKNARKTAESYLDGQAFSRSGLIGQLKFDSYSKADAVYAVNHVDVNWKQQAARAAKSYLDSQSFSRAGLRDQLKFDGFTPAQAAYGVAAAY